MIHYSIPDMAIFPLQAVRSLLSKFSSLSKENKNLMKKKQRSSLISNCFLTIFHKCLNIKNKHISWNNNDFQLI